MKRVMKRNWGRWLAGVLSVVLVLTLLPTTVFAAESSTDYFDPTDKGNENKTATNAEEITEGSAPTTWTGTEGESWYVVNSSVTINDRITVTGDVNLILADSGNLTASKGITVNQGASLTIWGQSGGTGTLTATSGDEWWAGIGSSGGDYPGDTCGTITINGGTIVIVDAYTKGNEKKSAERSYER